TRTPVLQTSTKASSPSALKNFSRAKDRSDEPHVPDISFVIGVAQSCRCRGGIPGEPDVTIPGDCCCSCSCCVPEFPVAGAPTRRTAVAAGDWGSLARHHFRAEPDGWRIQDRRRRLHFPALGRTSRGCWIDAG